MIHVVPSNDRHYADFGWLKTRWHFSFDSYYDPANTNWGALRVFNDDLIEGGGGFGAHGHRDMEIVTYVLDGALEHADSIGSRHVLNAGEVQVMSAGKGIRHSEYNASPTEQAKFVQLWILPRHKGNEPRWEQRSFGDRTNRLLPVVSSGDVPDTLAIDQDADIFVSLLEPEHELTHTLAPGRKGYMFVFEGALDVNGQRLGKGDQARIESESGLRIRSAEKAHFILLDLPA